MRPFCACSGKKPLHTGVRTGCILLLACPFGCMSVCVRFVGFTSGRVWANAWVVFRRKLSRGSRGRRDAVDFVV